MEILLTINLLLAICGILTIMFLNIEAKKEKENKNNKKIEDIKKEISLPKERDFDKDFKYLNFIINFQCSETYKNKIFLDTEKSLGKRNIIDDNMFNEYVLFTSEYVLEKLSNDYIKIIKFYSGENYQLFIIEMIRTKLLDIVTKTNKITIKNYN